jgi:hypothetical protein
MEIKSSSFKLPANAPEGRKAISYQLDLSGQALLLPQDEAFHPAVNGLNWRCEQLIA